MFVIRRALDSDEAALGRFGGALMRQHHASDPKRFLFVENPEAGYGRFLASQLSKPDCLVLVAESETKVVGYVFAQIYPTSWMDLRGPCGFVHDVYVDERMRGKGAATALLREAITWVRSRGMTQIVLWSKSRNDSAQRLFTKLGFRATMIEMTRDEVAPTQP